MVKGQIAWNKGIPWSEEVKRKISVGNKGKLAGDNNPAKRPEVRKKISDALKGRDAYWLVGKKRPNHSKFMKRYLLENGFPKGFGEGSINHCNGHSKLHDAIKSILNTIEGFAFESEVVLGNYIFDEVDQTKKLILEINGDLFHANPKIFNATDNPNPFVKTLTAIEIWKKDRLKKEYAESLGFSVLYLWEKDFRKLDKKEVVRWIKSIISS